MKKEMASWTFSVQKSAAAWSVVLCLPATYHCLLQAGSNGNGSFMTCGTP